jgi:ATP-dependent DNA helicase RecQ
MPSLRKSKPITARSLQRLLKSRFGLESFRPGQEEVIRKILEGHDALAIMPTGAGKSLCYQLPALLLPGTTVVVSPLIALMNDQADKLDEAGVDIETINSTLSRSDQTQAFARIASQTSEIVFVTPEQLSSEHVLHRLAGNPIDLFVIDEAHCISQWGHDFRPAFLQLADAIAALDNPPVLPLTATAPDAVIDDIREQLRRPGMSVINAGIYRPNLHYGVKQVSSEEEKLAELEALLRAVPGAAIVYTATVKAAEAVHRHLAAKDLDALLYHGRMRPMDRNESQRSFMECSAVMVATNAFGMGIDKPDVRAVVHYQMPASLESYYQESGRAGRDGEIARCMLLFEHADKRIQSFFLAGRYPEVSDVQGVWAALDAEPARCEGVASRTLAGLGGTVPRNKARVALKALVYGHLVKLEAGRYFPLGCPLDAGLAQGVVQQYCNRVERDREKLEQLIAYAQSGRCRWQTLLEHFGERPQWQRCGVCDNCRHPPQPILPAGHHDSPPALHDALALGRRVMVPRFGEGVISAIAGNIVTIEFPKTRRRNFLRSFVTVVGDHQ